MPSRDDSDDDDRGVVRLTKRQREFALLQTKHSGNSYQLLPPEKDTKVFLHSSAVNLSAQ